MGRRARRLGAFAVLAALLLGSPTHAGAASLRFAYERDLRSLDPYAGQETFLRSFDANIYEPLVRRGRDLALEPGLAQSWRPVSPTLWRFRLRDGVRFQDGTPFTADDVLFSFERARAPGSRIAALLASVSAVRAVDAHTVEIATKERDPLLLARLSEWPIVSRAWCLAHDAAAPSDPAGEAYANDHANGTGPFAVEARVPGERTVLTANPRWWDKRQGNLDRVEFTPIAETDELLARLKSGALDMVYDVPLPAVAAIAALPGFRIVEGPSLTTIVLGFDEWSRELPESSVKGANPFKDRRVRAAVAAAIDEPQIISRVMHGHATPAGLIVGPGVAGYDAALDARPAYDPARARKLLAEAGYPNGFATGMDCPKDRYVNDEAICEEVVAMLAKVGIAVELHAEDRAQFFANIMPLDPPKARSSFFLMGWTPASYDAGAALANLAATRDPKARLGEFNAAGYSNPALDALLKRAAAETEGPARLALLRSALELVKTDIAYVPLHRQNLVWAAREGITLLQRPDDTFPLRYVEMR
jgi:peptide/nickel transport system substrate-binding protein